MAYYTGTAANMLDLLDKLKLHAEAESVFTWVTTKAGVNYTFATIDLTLTVHYYNFPSTTYAGVKLTGATTAGGANTLGAIAVESLGQFDIRAGCANIPKTAIGMKYHIFFSETKPRFYCAFEIAAGIWRHFGGGVINKRGVWDGGLITMGSTVIDSNLELGRGGMIDGGGAFGNFKAATITYKDPDAPFAMIRADAGFGFNGNISPPPFKIMGSSPYPNGNDFQFNWSSTWLNDVSPNEITGEVVMETPEFALYDNASVLHPCGYLDDIANLNIKNLVPGQELVIDTKTWVVFPMASKGLKTIGPLQYNTLDRGIAYRKA